MQKCHLFQFFLYKEIFPLTVQIKREENLNQFNFSRSQRIAVTGEHYWPTDIPRACFTLSLSFPIFPLQGPASPSSILLPVVLALPQDPAWAVPTPLPQSSPCTHSTALGVMLSWVLQLWASALPSGGTSHWQQGRCTVLPPNTRGRMSDQGLEGGILWEHGLSQP